MFTLVTQDNVENFSINININSPAIHSFDCSKLNGFLLIFLIPERIKTFTYYSIVKELARSFLMAARKILVQKKDSGVFITSKSHAQLFFYKRTKKMVEMTGVEPATL